MELTHASFFSGVGGLDLGLERAGWRTVSFSEIDPYANAVLAERWPGVPNIGCIRGLAGHYGPHDHIGYDCVPLGSRDRDARPVRSGHRPDAGSDAARALLWSGGFPCTDLSVAGKRAGFGLDYSLAGADADRLGHHGPDLTRSGLAFAFLSLVERHRPPAVLLENVPGLLSSHRGRDMAALVGLLAELGYGWAYRILDARHFGVPQRRRRVFIVALDLERGFTADRAAEVLSVGSRCDRHPPTGVEAGPGVADGTGDGAIGTFTAGAHPGSYNGQDAYTGHLIAHGLRASDGHHGYSSPRGDGADNLVSSPLDPGGVRAPDGLAGRVDDLAPTLRVGPATPQDGGPGDTVPITVGPLLSSTQGGQRSTDLNTPLAFVKRARAQTTEDDESWGEGDVMPTLNAFDVGDTRTTAAILGSSQARNDPLLPLGLDSHRYRCCGNGVVSSVAEWIGLRLAAVFT